MLYGEETLSTVDVDASKDEFKDTKNGGDIEKTQKLKNKAREMSYAIQNPDNGCPEQIYKALVKAKELGLIGNETSWDEAITLSDAITLYYNTAVTKYAASSTTTASTTTSKKDDSSKSDTNSSDNLPESKSWPEYKETVGYYLDKGLISEQSAHALNPDIYGTETAGKSDNEVISPLETGIDASVDIRRLMVKTTKGFEIEAWYYVDANKVQFVYTGEVTPFGGWFNDESSADVLDDYARAKYGSANFMNLTHQDKIDALGTTTMSEAEVIAALQ